MVFKKRLMQCTGGEKFHMATNSLLGFFFDALFCNIQLSAVYEAQMFEPRAD